MPFTAAQTTAFFETAEQMGMTAETRARLQTEGIETVADLFDFDEDVCAYMCTCACMHVCIYIYICIYTHMLKSEEH